MADKKPKKPHTWDSQGIYSVMPMGVKGPIRVWTSGHNLRGSTRVMTPDGQFQTIRVKVDMRPLVKAMIRWHVAKGGKFSPTDAKLLNDFFAGAPVFGREEIAVGKCGPLTIGGGPTPHIDVVGLDSLEHTGQLPDSDIETDETGTSYRLKIGCPCDGMSGDILGRSGPFEIVGGGLAMGAANSFMAKAIEVAPGRIDPNVRLMKQHGVPRVYRQRMGKIRRRRPDGVIETSNAFITESVWDAANNRWVPFSRDRVGISITKRLSRAVKKAVKVTPAYHMLKTANEVAKNKVVKSVTRATKAVVRNPYVGAGLGALAVAFPPVGVPAAAAFAVANQTLQKIDQAEKIKRDVQKAVSTGNKVAQSVFKRQLPQLSRALSEASRAKDNIQKLGMSAARGNPQAKKAIAIFNVVSATRNAQRGMVPMAARSFAAPLPVALRQAPQALKRYFLNSHGIPVFG